MNSSNSNWELMCQGQRFRDAAKAAKASSAHDCEKVREVLEALRSMRYWLNAAQEQGKTLKARKQLVAQGESEIVAMGRLATGFVCDQLSTANTAANIRNAFSWFAVAQKVTTFKEWDEVVSEFNTCCTIAILRLGVTLETIKDEWKNAKRNMVASNIKVRKYAKEILAPVAIPKAQRKEMVRVYCAKRQVLVFAKGYNNSDLYHYAINTNKNQYNNISASACITQRRIDSLYISTKMWLRLVRNTRFTALLRASMFNDRQDYLVRLPVYHGGGINLR